jgi:hypothetical protein
VTERHQRGRVGRIIAGRAFVAGQRKGVARCIRKIGVMTSAAT